MKKIILEAKNAEMAVMATLEDGVVQVSVKTDFFELTIKSPESDPAGIYRLAQKMCMAAFGQGPSALDLVYDIDEWGFPIFLPLIEDEDELDYNGGE